MKAGTPSQREKAAQHQAASGIGTMPNFSAAVSAQRFEAQNSLDDFPTPPWGELRRQVVLSKAARNAQGRKHVGGAPRPVAISAAMAECYARAHALNRVGTP